MTSLVVYEAMFGATKALAQEAALTLGEQGPAWMSVDMVASKPCNSVCTATSAPRSEMNYA